MSRTIIGSATKVKKHHKEQIRQEHVRLNGSARSTRGRNKLIRFAEKTCGIVINDLVLGEILRGQNGNGAPVGKPACKTRSSRSRSRKTF